MDDLILASLSWRLFGYSTKDFHALKLLRLAGVSWERLSEQFPTDHPLQKLQELKDFWNEPQRIQDYATKHFPNCRLKFHSFLDEDVSDIFYSKIEQPFLLTSFGTDIDSKGLRLGVVGSREPRYGLSEFLDRWLARQLQQNDLTIISGGARGVDQLAHQSAFVNQKQSWIWLPSGLFDIYPKNLLRWMSLVEENKATLISPFHPHTSMRKHLFSIRNAFIAASSHSLIIASAANKSGTMITAQRAIEMNTPIYCISSDPWSISAQGSLALIRDGANMIVDEADGPDWKSIL